MMEIDKKYPKFNNWESDTLHGNSKGIMYMGVIVMIYLTSAYFKKIQVEWNCPV